MRLSLEKLGHRVSIITDDLAEAGDAGASVVTPETRLHYWLRRTLGRVSIEYADPFTYWRRILGRLQQIDAATPVDVFEIEEAFGWGGMLQRHTSIPVVVKLHGPAFLTLTKEEQKPQFMQQRIAIEGKYLEPPAAVTSPSASALDSARSFYRLALDRARHVRNPLLVPEETPLWRLDQCERDTILFVGRFDNIKGGDLVLKAFRSLLRERPHLKLVFVGPDPGLTRHDGSREHMPEFLAREFAGSNAAAVDYVGHQSREKIEALRVKAMLTIVASRWESQCYAALEAMAQACPVVAFATGGISELIHHRETGCLAKPEDVADFHAQIAYLLDHPTDAERMGAQARSFVLKEHAPDVVAQQTLAVYASVRRAH